MSNSVRLTNTIRERITSKAIEVSFKSKNEALELLEHSLAGRAYAEAVPESIRKHIELFPDKKWFTKISMFKVNARGYQVVLRPASSVYVEPGYCSYNTFHHIKGESLAEEVIQFANTKEALKSEIKNAKSKLKSMIDSYTTLGALAKAWPEGAPFYNSYFATTHNLPVSNFSDINKTLGLPI